MFPQWESGTGGAGSVCGCGVESQRLQAPSEGQRFVPAAVSEVSGAGDCGWWFSMVTVIVVKCTERICSGSFKCDYVYSSGSRSSQYLFL